MNGDYQEFLDKKTHWGEFSGFDPIWIPDSLFDFQKSLTTWAIKKGRCAIFADCGLGKSFMQLVWAENVARKTNGNILIFTPLAVAQQTVKEGVKFGIECAKSDDGKPKGKITITNYEKLHLFDVNDYVGVVCDESSILKNFDGTRKNQITDFMRKKAYRLCCTATAAPNDYVELGTTSEALGELGYMDMLNRFFKNDNNTCDRKGFHSQKINWRFKKHAEKPFWQWVSSWARALRKPSDLGFSDEQFILPPLHENHVFIENTKPLPGEMFVRPAIGLQEQRKELRLTLTERCEKVAELVNQNGISLVWCNLNDEGDLLERLIPGAKQVSGKDSDDQKEEIIQSFLDNELKVLITKPKIAGFGLNLQHCAHMTFFPSHSFEQYYQGVRRCWRFGQKKPVVVDIVSTGGSQQVFENLQRKARASEKMFDELVTYMNDAIKIESLKYDKEMRRPSWL